MTHHRLRSAIGATVREGLQDLADMLAAAQLVGAHDYPPQTAARRVAAIRAELTALKQEASQ